MAERKRERNRRKERYREIDDLVNIYLSKM